eukprot:4729970-Pyramimonas_sp.AAC.1
MAYPSVVMALYHVQWSGHHPLCSMVRASSAVFDGSPHCKTSGVRGLSLVHRASRSSENTKGHLGGGRLNRTSLKRAATTRRLPA